MTERKTPKSLVTVGSQEVAEGAQGVVINIATAHFGIPVADSLPASEANGLPATPAEPLEIPLGAHGHFAGTVVDAGYLILRIDAALAANEPVCIKLLVPQEAELVARATAKDSPEAVITAAEAKLALAALNKWRKKLEGLLDFFLMDARFRAAFVPQRERAAVSLISLINDDAEKHGVDGFTKIGLFPEREPSVGTSIMLRTEELKAPAETDGCGSVEAYKAKLLAMRGDMLMALPERVRLELAYPAIVRELVCLRDAGHLKEEWLRPVNWAFGLD